MHSFKHHHHESGEASAKATNGLIMKGGWRYDLHGWFFDTCVFRGKGRELRQRTTTLARLQPGDQVLDVGCGTGTLALEVQRRVGSAGRVVGIEPGTEQIARARAKAARRDVPIEFQIGVIEHIAFPDQTFDVVLSTLMMHHLPASLKAQGLAEIARVLKPGGRLVIADFTRKQERVGQAARFHAGGSGLSELAALVADAGFAQVDMEEMRPHASLHSQAPALLGHTKAQTHMRSTKAQDSAMSNGFVRHTRGVLDGACGAPVSARCARFSGVSSLQSVASHLAAMGW